LGPISEIDPKAASIWSEEAQMRDREMDGDRVTGIPAEQVFDKISGFL